MTELIYGWMQNLAFFFILMTAVLNCLPENQYRKYVQFFLGMVLMIVMCRPLLQVLDLDQFLSDNLSSQIFEQEVQNSKNSALTVEGVQEDYLTRAYEGEIENQIRILLQEKGITVITADVSLKGEEDKMCVEEIRLEVSNPEVPMYQEDEETLNRDFEKKLEDVRKELSEVYELDESHIDISRG